MVVNAADETLERVEEILQNSTEKCQTNEAKKKMEDVEIAVTVRKQGILLLDQKLCLFKRQQSKENLEIKIYF